MMVPLFRLTGSFTCALCVTLILCLSAPLMSQKSEKPVPRVLQPIRVFAQAPQLEKPEQIKITPPKMLPMAAFPKKKNYPKERMKPEDIRLSPLQLEAVPLAAAALPTPLPQAPTPKPVKAKAIQVAKEASQVFDLGSVDTPPRLKWYRPPLYPRRAKGQQVQGKVFVRCLVSAGGRVTDARVIKAEPAGYFERAALKSVKKWTFVPAEFKGEKVAVFVDIPLSFHLD